MTENKTSKQQVSHSSLESKKPSGFPEERLNKIAQRARLSKAITLWELIQIMAADENYNDVLPQLWEIYDLNSKKANKIPLREINTNTVQERTAVWHWLLTRWAAISEYEEFYFKELPQYPRLPLHYYEGGRLAEVRGDKERKESHFVELEHFAGYLEDTKKNYRLNIPLPQLLYPEKYRIEKNYGADKSTRPLPQEEYGFFQEGPSWTITYEGKTLRGLKGKGFGLIWYLVLNERKVFTTAELGAEVDNIVIYEGKGLNGIYSDHSDDERKVDKGGVDSRDKTYGNSLEELKEHHSYLKEEIRKAEENNDLAQKDKLQKELEEFNKYVSKYINLKGHPRRDRDDFIKTKDRICKRIERALDVIQKNDQNTWRHFYSALRPINSYFHSYDPDRDINWLTK